MNFEWDENKNSSNNKNMEYNKEIILKMLSENSETIKNFGADKIGLFGSYSQDEQKINSDIDFIVKFNKEKKTYKNFIRLTYFLEDLFKTKIDLITIKSLRKNRNFTTNVINQTIYATL